MQDLRDSTREFADRLGEIRGRILPSNGMSWHPSYSIYNFVHVIDVLESSGKGEIVNNLKNKKVVDIGPSDGDIGFLFEHLGASVDFIDYPPVTFNQMAGLRTMASELNSTAGIYEIDVDSQFGLPRQYDIVIFLGILYHLKNPYYALEQLARNTQYLFFSTKLAEYTAPLGDLRRAPLSGPVAYLLDAYEANNDSTNYWVFSDLGLKRLLERTGWSVEGEKTVGAEAAASDPMSPDGDRRIFCLLRSTVFSATSAR